MWKPARHNKSTEKLLEKTQKELKTRVESIHTEIDKIRPQAKINNPEAEDAPGKSQKTADEREI